MATLSSGDDHPCSYSADDYRAWLISRNQPPIIHHSVFIRIKRLQVYARQIVSGAGKILHRMSGVSPRHGQK